MQECRHPSANWLKCNIDASVFDDGNILGRGYVVRDSTGSVIAVRATLLPGGGDAFAAEAMSCREVLSGLKDNHFDFCYFGARRH